MCAVLTNICIEKCFMSRLHHPEVLLKVLYRLSLSKSKELINPRKETLLYVAMKAWRYVHVYVINWLFPMSVLRTGERAPWIILCKPDILSIHKCDRVYSILKAEIKILLPIFTAHSLPRAIKERKKHYDTTSIMHTERWKFSNTSYPQYQGV